MDEVQVAHDQLVRMRGMTAAYHRQFFNDVRFALTLGVGLFVVGFGGIEPAFLLIPFVMLWAACQTAFDASYLHFARHYAAGLERFINRRLSNKVLVAHEMEEVYLYPLRTPKLVTVSLRGPVSWFGFMTMFITAGGIAMTVASAWLGWDLLGGAAFTVYWVGYGLLAISALIAGLWWFVQGVGEQRLDGVLRDAGFMASGG